MRWISAAVVVVVAGAGVGCASPGRDAVLRTDGPRMVELFRGIGDVEGGEPRAAVRGPGKCSWLGRFMRICGAAKEGPDSEGPEGDLAAYTRGASNELELLFPRLPNPDIRIYVYPHLATEARVPVPGYTTAVPLYERVEYAMPGEAVCFNGKCGDGRRAEPEVAVAVRSRAGVEAAGGAAVVEEAEADVPGMEQSWARAVATPANAGDVVVEAGSRTADEREEQDREPEGVSGGVEREEEFGVAEQRRAFAALVRVRVERGSLRANVDRLLEQFGYRIGRWPGDADYVVDWIISGDYVLEVHGLEGLLRSLLGYGLTSEVVEGDSRVDFGVVK